MFDIVTIEPEDTVVAKAVKAMTTNGKAFITVPKEGYRYIAVNAHEVIGNGGDGNVLAVVGHAGPDTLSGEKTWDSFVQQVTAEIEPDWRKNKTTVYLVACSTAGKGTKFEYGNIATEIKAKFPKATVWASSIGVSATDLSGEWTKV